MRLQLVLSVTLLGLLPLACGSSQSDANDPNQAQNQYGAQPGYQQGAPGQYTPPQGYQDPSQQPGYQQPGYQQPGYQQPQPAATGTAPAVPVGSPPASGSPATAIAPAAAAMVQPILQGLAASEVPGMQPDGGPFAAQFQEGQVWEQAINIAAGKCYSVVAASAGIQELDVQLVLNAPPLPPQVLATDSTTGPNATLGGKGQCFKNPLPLGGPGKVVVKATRGAGAAIAQVYVK